VCRRVTKGWCVFTSIHRVFACIQSAQAPSHLPFFAHIFLIFPSHFSSFASTAAGSRTSSAYTGCKRRQAQRRAAFLPHLRRRTLNPRVRARNCLHACILYMYRMYAYDTCIVCMHCLFLLHGPSRCKRHGSPLLAGASLPIAPASRQARGANPFPGVTPSNFAHLPKRLRQQYLNMMHNLTKKHFRCVLHSTFARVLVCSVAARALPACCLTPAFAAGTSRGRT